MAGVRVWRVHDEGGACQTEEVGNDGDAAGELVEGGACLAGGGEEVDQDVECGELGLDRACVAEDLKDEADVLRGGGDRRNLCARLFGPARDDKPEKRDEVKGVV